MSGIEVFQVDAFTRVPFTGNPAGVVLGADALSAAQMQQLARELHLGDTVFASALRAGGDDTGTVPDVHVRFFNTRAEAGFVGHATLALHAVLARMGARTRTQTHRNGSATVRVLTTPDGPQFAIRQPPPLLGEAAEPAMLAEVLAALGVRAAEVDARCPAQFAGASRARLLIGLADGAAIAALQPDQARLAQLSAAGGPAGYYVFTLAPQTASDVESRMFCPALGIAEDPVSGNAHGMLASYLLTHHLFPHEDPDAPELLLRGAQGHHMGRPGQVEVALQRQSGRLESLEIRGAATIVLEARIAPGVFA